MATATRTTHEILGSNETRDVMLEIFADLHPGLIDERRPIDSIFTPNTARDFIMQLSSVTESLEESDTFDETLRKLQALIDRAEEVRDDLLEEVYEQVRPMERSYRQLQIFFENSKVYDGKQRKPVEQPKETVAA